LGGEEGDIGGSKGLPGDGSVVLLPGVHNPGGLLQGAQGESDSEGTKSEVRGV